MTEAYKLAKRYFDAVVDCLDPVTILSIKTRREAALKANVLNDCAAAALVFKADKHLIKHREDILDLAYDNPSLLKEIYTEEDKINRQTLLFEIDKLEDYCYFITEPFKVVKEVSYD